MGAISQQLGVAMQSMDTMAVSARYMPSAGVYMSASSGSHAHAVRAIAEQIAQNMDEFERQLNELDMQGTMINATMAMGATSTPVDEVDTLISQVADEANLNLAEKCGPATSAPYPQPPPTLIPMTAPLPCCVLCGLYQ